MAAVSRRRLYLLLALLFLYAAAVYLMFNLETLAPPRCHLSENGWLQIKAEGVPNVFGVVEVHSGDSRCRLELTAGETYRIDLNASQVTIRVVANPMVMGIVYAMPTSINATAEAPTATLTIERYEWYSHIAAILSLAGVVALQLLSPPRLVFINYWTPQIRPRDIVAAYATSFAVMLPAIYIAVNSVFNYVFFNYGGFVFLLIIFSILYLPLILPIDRRNKASVAKDSVPSMQLYLAEISFKITLLIMIVTAVFYSFSYLILWYLQIYIPPTSLASLDLWTPLTLGVGIPLLFLYVLGKGDPEFLKFLLSPLAVEESLAHRRMVKDVTENLVWAVKDKSEFPIIDVRGKCIVVYGDAVRELCGRDIAEFQFKKVEIWEDNPKDIEIWLAPLGDRGLYLAKLFIKASLCSVKTDTAVYHTGYSGGRAVVTAVGRQIDVKCHGGLEVEPVEEVIYGRAWDGTHVKLRVLGQYTSPYGYPQPVRLKTYVDRRGRIFKKIHINIEVA